MGAGSVSTVQAATAYLSCFEPGCGERYPITEASYNCAACGGLLDVRYEWSGMDAAAQKRVWLERKMSRDPRDLSGVWRFREILQIGRAHV